MGCKCVCVCMHFCVLVHAPLCAHMDARSRSRVAFSAPHHHFLEVLLEPALWGSLGLRANVYRIRYFPLSHRFSFVTDASGHIRKAAWKRILDLDSGAKHLWPQTWHSMESWVWPGC